MEIFKIVKVVDPKGGNEVNLYLSEEEAQILIQHAMNYLISIGAASLTDTRDGVNINDFVMDEKGKPN